MATRLSTWRVYLIPPQPHIGVLAGTRFPPLLDHAPSLLCRERTMPPHLPRSKGIGEPASSVTLPCGGRWPSEWERQDSNLRSTRQRFYRPSALSRLHTLPNSRDSVYRTRPHQDWTFHLRGARLPVVSCRAGMDHREIVTRAGLTRTRVVIPQGRWSRARHRSSKSQLPASYLAWFAVLPWEDYCCTNG
jgi:hypothetical protein